MTNNVNSVKSVPMKVAELTGLASQVLESLKRDETELKTFGISVEQTDDLERQIKLVQSITYDRSFKAQLRIGAKAKNAQKAKLHLALKTVKFLLSAQNGRYFQNDFMLVLQGMNLNSDLQLNTQLQGEINRLKADDLVKNASPELSKAISELENALHVFNLMYAEQLTLKKKRRQYVTERQNTLHSLYITVGNLCAIAKAYWSLKSDHRYMDYRMKSWKKTPSSATVPVEPKEVAA